MAAFEQTRIFNPDFNIEWSFGNPRGGSHTKSRRTVNAAKNIPYSGAILDRLVDQLEKKDTPVVRFTCYVFCSVCFMYLAGQMVRAALN